MIRKVISSVFTPKMVDRLEVNMRKTAARAIEDAIAEGECEFTRVAQKLPVSVICDMMGIPQSDWDFMVDRTRFAWSSTALDETEEARKVQAHTEILCYFQELAEERRRQPQNDLMSALVCGQGPGVLAKCRFHPTGATTRSSVSPLVAAVPGPTALADRIGTNRENAGALGVW